VARAKRTDRADARRRYRAAQGETGEVDESADDTPVTTPSRTVTGGQASRGKGRQPAQQPQRPVFAPGERPSFTASFRAAARPWNLREDLAYTPELITRTRAVWLPGLAAIGSGVFFLAVQPLGSNGIANLLFQLFVLPPTIAGAFLAGILAPRATYIAGGIAALIGALVFSVAVLITPTNLATATVPSASPTPAPSATESPVASGSPAPSISAAPSPSASPAPQPSAPLSDADKLAAVLQSLLISVPFGVAIGAFGGYYKRFLYVSNPARQRRALEQQRQKARQQQTGKKRY